MINVVAKSICKETLRVMDGSDLADPTSPLVKLEKCVEKLSCKNSTSTVQLDDRLNCLKDLTSVLEDLSLRSSKSASCLSLRSSKNANPF